MFKNKKLSSLSAYHVKKTAMKWIVGIFKFFFLAGMCYLFLFPIIYLITSAFQDPSTANDPTIIFVPTKLSLDNFKLAFEDMSYIKAALTSVLLTSFGTLATLFSCAMVGYGFARYKFFENKFAFILVIILIIIPPQTTTIPTFINFANFDFFGLLTLFGIPPINLTTTPLAMIIPALFASGLRAGLCIYIFRQFFLGQPKELEEAAKIDGCSALGTYFKVMLPLASPAIITVAVLSAVWYWTDSFYTGIFFDAAQDATFKIFDIELQALYPLSSALAVLRDRATASGGSNPYNPYQVRGLLAAAAILTVSPMLIIYFIVQRKFTESIERTGIVG